MSVDWLAGEAALRGPLEATVAGSRTPGRTLAESPRRRVSLLELGAALPLVLKHFHSRRGGGTLQRTKRLTGQTAAAREWRALGALARAGLRAPARRAWLRRGDEEWLAMAFVPGQPFGDVLLAADGPRRRALIERLGQLVREVHAAGIVHGDLHLGNVLAGEANEPVLVDWQRARVHGLAPAQRRDLAALEFSFARSSLGRADRLRLRRAVLGGGRSALRAAGGRAAAFAHDHYRGRTRRCLRDGGGQTPFADPAGNGLRVRELPLAAVREALAAHDAALAAGGPVVLKSDERARVTRVSVGDRTLIAKEVIKGGVARRLADPLRGSPAQRGWVGGHGLQARRIGVARPLAWMDRRDGSGRSVLLMEDVGDQPCLETAPPDQIDPDALLRLLLTLHRRGVDHGDLQASHIFGLRAPRLIDLEGIRFRRRLGDDARVRALAELNASLPDTSLPADVRCVLFRRYAAALPFQMPAERALREVVRRSLARRHAWRGEGCAAGRVSSPPP